MRDKYWFLQNSFDVLLDVLKPVNLSIVAAASSSLPDIIFVNGCITLDKHIRGKTLLQIEKEQGFEQGSLRSGMMVAALMRLPYKHEFDIRANEKSPLYKAGRNNAVSQDVHTLKHTTIKHVWRTYGPNCVVKVVPAIAYKKTFAGGDHALMPEPGIQQWMLTPSTQIAAVVIGRINEYPFGRYT